MSEPKFTPGPWNKTALFWGLRYLDKNDGAWSEYYDDKSYIPTENDAQLISLAPELLKAVETLIHEQCQITCKDWEKECSPDCWVLEYKKLIAEAKGEE